MLTFYIWSMTKDRSRDFETISASVKMANKVNEIIFCSKNIQPIHKSQHCLLNFMQSKPFQNIQLQNSLKNSHMHFHINSTSNIRSVKQNKLRFSRTEMNKLLPTPFHSFSSMRLKLPSQIQLSAHIRCLRNSSIN